MPTPFYHLVFAEAMLADERLQNDIRACLQQHRGAFLFGNTAPDVQTLSGKLREATHFFRVPLQDDTPAYQAMFTFYPQLGQPSALHAEQVAFLAGYICHLLVDQRWIREIFQPRFGLSATWRAFSDRLFLHNVLRIYLDRQSQSHLPAETGNVLAKVQPDNWLPFESDQYLFAWRDFLAEQLSPQAEIRTVEVFASRMGRDPADFEAILNEPAALHKQVFQRISENALAEFRLQALAESINLMHSYFDMAH